jgi:predicted nucleic acid-binding protein
VITLDTSGLLALFDRKDPYHAACVEAYTTDGGPAIIPAAILAEIGWFLEDRRRFAPQLLRTFLADLSEGAYAVEWSNDDVGRIAYLVERYDDLPLGVADAAVVACAERRGGRVLTTDGHFSQVVERDPTVRIAVFPALRGET